MKLLSGLLYTLSRPVILVGVLFLLPVLALAQASTQSHGSFDFNGDGVIFQSADSTTRVVMRFRMQNWLVYNTKFQDEDEDLDLSAGTTELAIRRLRLRFGGALVDPRLTFNLQLAFSRSDMDWADTQFPNIIRDAMIFWNFSPTLQVGFGQTKLPGNRQRVISSADIEFPDRSIVNGAFNLDRDFGIQGFWRPITGSVIMNLRGAISSGDGRNQAAIAGGGLAYTGRVEVLPLGAFTGGGDYFEGDLAGEQTPKLSIGFSAHHNDNETKTRGALGKLLYTQRTADVLYGDVLFKYSGLSLYGEWAQRTADHPVTRDAKDTTLKSAILVGNGMLAQATYTFRNMWAVGVRYGRVRAGDQLAGLPDHVMDENIGGVVTYYINRHRIKANIEVGTNRKTFLSKNDALETNLYSRFNMELGI